MAARLYYKGKENILGGEVDLVNDNLVCLLVTGEYLPDITSDESRASIPESAIVGEETISGATVLNGVFDADDVTFNSLEGSQVYHVVICTDSPIQSQALLIALYDSPVAVITPDGSDVVIQWDDGANKIFKI